MVDWNKLKSYGFNYAQCHPVLWTITSAIQKLLLVKHFLSSRTNRDKLQPLQVFHSL
jgi:hypothetical protein